jgi:hypothetical protein
MTVLDAGASAVGRLRSGASHVTDPGSLDPTNDLEPGHRLLAEQA